MGSIIGITTGEIVNLKYEWAPVVYGQWHIYSDAVIAAGGVPVLIPIIKNQDTLEELYKNLDGLLFAGGNDIDPRLYGEEPMTQTVDVSPKRDTSEFNLMRWTLRDKKPILAICRGMQLLNIVCGGTLYQHLASQMPSAEDHELSSHKKNVEHITHHLKVDPSSKLAEIIKATTIGANSHHHQAIKEIGAGLKVSAKSEDGMIEAVELSNAPYVIGVQCHPEALQKVEPKWNLLFKSFASSTNRLQKLKRL
ncbi:MAG: gamma-glutamyl-gamma-aminobutyrate hydrolase family protein [Candidatus Saccharimonadales bacterium]